MRWTPGGSGSDIEDRRGSSGGGGFGIGGAPMGIGGAVVLLVLSLIFHKNFFALFSGGSSQPAASSRSAEQSPPANETPQEHQEVEFVKFVLNDAQSTWEQVLQQQANVPYHHAKLVLFRDGINSGCGFAQAATGPFYCPEDEKVYIDLAFYEELQKRFGAPGDFAQAYVIAHEIGHHVQKVLGIEQKAHQLMEQDPNNAKAYSALATNAQAFSALAVASGGRTRGPRGTLLLPVVSHGRALL